MDTRQTEELHTPMQKLSLNEKNVSTKSATEQADPGAAKMLIFLENGEHRLISFTIQKESCTLLEVFEEVNIPVSEDTHVQCMQNSKSNIDYFVVIGGTTRIEDLIEKHPQLFRECFEKKENNETCPENRTCSSGSPALE